MNLRSARIILGALLALEIALLVFGPQAKDHLPDIAAAEAAGKRPDWWDDAAMGLRYAACINIGLLTLLTATSKFWMRPLSPALPNQEPGARNRERGSPKWFGPLVVGAAILCLGLRLPLASKSLWWDEAWGILQASHGKWIPDKKHDGDLKFLAHDWKRCAWYYQKPTNHAPMSLLQKASLNAWRSATGAARNSFSDLAARVPALLASMAAVILLACLLRAWGYPGAGIAAAFVLALHPWHIRYGVDARAYALVVPLCISGMFAVTRLAETSGRKIWPWLWWGLTAFLWIWAYPNSVLDVAVLNIVAAMLLWKHHETSRDRWTCLLRLVVTNGFAAILCLQLFLPNLMQARHWAGQEADKHVLNLSLASETASLLLCGRSAAEPHWHLAILGGALLMMAASFAWLFVNRRALQQGAMVLPALTASAIIFGIITWTFESYYYPRFVIALLPVVIAALTLALSQMLRPLPRVATAAAFLALSWKPAEILLTHPIAPLHDVADFVESIQDEKRAIVACYGLGREVMPVYEPSCVPLAGKSDVEAAMDRARTEHRGLTVIYGYSSFNRVIMPDGFALLDNRNLFEEIKSFPGIEPDFLFRVLRMK